MTRRGNGHRRQAWPWWAAGGAAVAAYAGIFHPWQRRWGATRSEARRSMPGDDDVPDPTFATTRAVTIEARPEDVWPWLVQMGAGRGGFYTHTSVQRLLGQEIENAERVHPELQSLKVGDTIPLGNGHAWEVREIEPDWLLLLAAEDATWCFELHPLDDERTRLVCRWRARVPRSPSGFLQAAVLDPGVFLMERKMLLGIKERAEALAAELEPGQPVP